jgi:hypothetical protein
MFLRAVVLGFSVACPLFLLEQGASFLRGSKFLQPEPGPDQTVNDGGRVFDVEFWGEFGQREAGSEGEGVVSSSSSSSTTSTPCPACVCGPGVRPSGLAPDEYGFAARVAYRAAVANDPEFDLIVLGFVVLYGLAAGTCGFALQGCWADLASRRSSSVATERLRPRGAGYRAGLTAPGGLR